MSKVMTAEQAAELIQDGAAVSIVGSGGGVMDPERVFEAVEKRFLATGHPAGITLIHASGIGDKREKGINRFAHEGLVRRVIGGHWGWSPRMQQMALEGKIEAYNFPQGIIASNFREIAAHRPGLITKVGMDTFVDPRIEGGVLNDRTPNDQVEVIRLGGEEWLHYRANPVDVAIIRGTVADAHGNISMEEEAAEFEVLAQAQAAHNSGGIVICQVKYLAKEHTLDPMLVKVPGIFVDAVVVDPRQVQTGEGAYNPAFRGQFRYPLEAMEPMPMSHRKVVARRCAMELEAGSIVNLGFGMSDGVATIASEEGFLDSITLSIEQGIVGGMPARGDIFGVAYNPEAIINAPSIFDFYSGQGLDMTCLGLAQADAHGNVNVSKFGTTIAGCGGFIDISQSAKKLVYCGTFTAGGLKTQIRDGKLHILQEGRVKKFVRDVEQITYSGSYGQRTGQQVIYVTERAVFRLGEKGMVLTEIAPGVDLERDVLGQMEFVPEIDSELKVMDGDLFMDKPLGRCGIQK